MVGLTTRDIAEWWNERMMCILRSRWKKQSYDTCDRNTCWDEMKKTGSSFGMRKAGGHRTKVGAHTAWIWIEENYMEEMKTGFSWSCLHNDIWSGQYWREDHGKRLRLHGYLVRRDGIKTVKKMKSRRRGRDHVHSVHAYIKFSRFALLDGIKNISVNILRFFICDICAAKTTRNIKYALRNATVPFLCVIQNFKAFLGTCQNVNCLQFTQILLQNKAKVSGFCVHICLENFQYVYCFKILYIAI